MNNRVVESSCARRLEIHSSSSLIEAYLSMSMTQSILLWKAVAHHKGRLVLLQHLLREQMTLGGVSCTPSRDVEWATILTVANSPLNTHGILVMGFRINRGSISLLEPVSKMMLLLLQIIEVKVHGWVRRGQCFCVRAILLIERGHSPVGTSKLMHALREVGLVGETSSIALMRVYSCRANLRFYSWNFDLLLRQTVHVPVSLLLTVSAAPILLLL